MQVGELNAAALRNIILADAKQAAAHRVYSITSTTGKQQFIKINADKKFISRNWLHHLRYAETDARIAKTLEMLSDKGYLVVTTDARAVTFGAPKSPVAPIPMPKPKPKPRAPRAPKPPPPGPHEPGPVQPKPKPTITEPPMPYDKPPAPPKAPPAPKPPPADAPLMGEAKDYSQHGLIDGVPLQDQIRQRIRIETERLNSALKAVETKLGRSLNSYERADYVRALVEVDTGTIAAMSAQEIRAATKVMDRAEYASVQSATIHQLRVRSLTRSGRGKVVATPMPPDRLEEFFNDALRHVSPRLLEYAKSKGFPRVFEASNVKDGAFFLPKLNAIVVPGDIARGRNLSATFRHEFGHYLDTIGVGEQASILFREMYQSSSMTFTAPGGWKYVAGKWGDMYSGRVYKFEASEMVSTAYESFASAATMRLSRMYDANPDQVGYMMAHAKGCFVK